MAQWFEDVTKTLADEKMGRRTAMRRVAGTVAGVALASALRGAALARVNKQCLIYGDCTTDFLNCRNNPNLNCYCFERLGGTAVCGCNTLCAQTITCSTSTKCPKDYLCIVSTGCNCSITQGVCAANCEKKKYRHCTFPDGHGLTVTGQMV